MRFVILCSAELIFQILYVVYRGQYGDCWPLSPAMRKVIEINTKDIVALLDMDDDLIAAVISKGCFTRKQLESVNGTTDERSMKLLDKIKRSSLDTLCCFLHCLDRKRSHVVPLLAEGKDLETTLSLCE